MLLAAGASFTAQTEAATVRLDALWLLAATLAALGWLGHRRLPAGMGAGLIVTAVSGAGLVTAAVGAERTVALVGLGHVLTALAIGWYVLSLLSGRRPAGATSSERPPVSGHILLQAAVVCGLAAAVSATVLSVHVPENRPGALIDLAGLLVLSVVAWAISGSPLSAYALLGVLGCCVASLIPRGWVAALRPGVPLAMVVIAVAGLLAVLAAAWARWAYRRRVWMQQPQRLTDPPARRRGLLRLVLAGSVAVGVGGVLFPTAPLTPVALLLSAIACLTIGHWQRSAGKGELGMALVGLGITTGGCAWVMPGWDGALLGCALAGVYLRWLSRFWEQQLLDGQPWTTAGMLIPVARRLGGIAGVACFGLALASELSAGTGGEQTVWRPAVAALVCLLLTALLIRDATGGGDAVSVLGACLAGMATVVPVRQVLAGPAGMAPSLIVLVAIMGLLLASAGLIRGLYERSRATFAGLGGGVIPVLALLGLLVGGGSLEGAVAAALAGLTVVVTLAFAMRFRHPEGSATGTDAG